MRNEIFQTTKDNVKLFGINWEIENPKAVVLIVHGFGEHIGRYEHVAKHLNENGFSVVGFDRRGEGQSEGHKGYADSYEVLLDEIDLWIDYVKTTNPSIPIFLYGHSLGGNLVLNTMINDNPNITGYISTSPWIVLAIVPPKLIMKLLPILAKVLPKFSQKNGLDAKDLSRDLQIGEDYVKDPYVGDKLTFKLASLILANAAHLNQYSTKLAKPLLLMHGDADKIISVEGSRKFSKIEAVDLTYKEWPEMRHETHNEIGKEEVLSTISDWLKNQLIKKA